MALRKERGMIKLAIKKKFNQREDIENISGIVVSYHVDWLSHSQTDRLTQPYLFNYMYAPMDY